MQETDVVLTPVPQANGAIKNRPGITKLEEVRSKFMNVSLTPQSEAIISKYMAQGYSIEEIIDQALQTFDDKGQSYTEWLQKEVLAGLQQAQDGKFSQRSIDEIITVAKAKQAE